MHRLIFRMKNQMVQMIWIPYLHQMKHLQSLQIPLTMAYPEETFTLWKLLKVKPEHCFILMLLCPIGNKISKYLQTLKAHLCGLFFNAYFCSLTPIK